MWFLAAFLWASSGIMAAAAIATGDGMLWVLMILAMAIAFSLSVTAVEEAL